MKRLKRIGIGIGVLATGLLAAVAMQPSTFHVERSASVGAAPAAVHANVSDFRNWKEWSPWEKLDPTMKSTYAGPASGVGSSYAWAGNDDVGEGKMTLTDSAPDKVVIALEFLKPFAATNTATFRFAPEGAGTRVTWAMDGEKNFLSKAFCLFGDMDAMIGKDFEAGLANLKAAVERAPPVAATR